MAYIDSLSTIYTTSKLQRKKTRKTGEGGAFSALLGASEDSASDVADVSTTAPLSGVNLMLGLQEVSDEDIRRKQAISHGRSSVAMLEELHHHLLMGSLPLSLLNRMNQLVQSERHRCHDPQLESLLDDIELRTAVELAKLEKAQAENPHV